MSARVLMLGLAALCGASGSSATTDTDPKLVFAFEEIVHLGTDIPAGRGPAGTRNIVPITGGSFAGPGIAGTVMAGGWDWQLRGGDGCTRIKADYMLRTDDGVIINVVNTGISCRARDPAAVVRTHPVFEAPSGKYDWLTHGAFIGTLDPATAGDGGRAVRIRFYRVT